MAQRRKKDITYNKDKLSIGVKQLTNTKEELFLTKMEVIKGKSREIKKKDTKPYWRYLGQNEQKSDMRDHLLKNPLKKKRLMNQCSSWIKEQSNEETKRLEDV